MNANMCGAINRIARFTRSGRYANQRKDEVLLGLGEKPLDAPVVDEIFEASLLAVRAIAILTEDANHGGSDRNRLVRTKKNAAIAGELLVAGDPAKEHAKVNSRRNALAISDADRDKSDVVGICNDTDSATVVKGDIELAWQVVHIPVIENVVAHRLGKRSDVKELGGIDTRNGRSGNVANVICAGAARRHAQVANLVEDPDDVFGLQLANLQVAARGQVDAARAPVGSHLRKATKLMCPEDAPRDAQAEHERVLSRGDVEEAMKLEAKEIVRRGSLVLVGVRNQFVPHIECMLFVLPALFLTEIGERCSEVSFFLKVGNCTGPIRKARDWIAGDLPRRGVTDERNGAALGHSGKEALQILLLLCGKRCGGDRSRRDRGLGCEGRVHATSLYEVSDMENCREGS